MLLIFALLWHKWPFGKMFALQSVCKFSPETTLLAAFPRMQGNLWAPPWNYPLPLHLSLIKMRLCPTSHLLSWWGTTATCYPGLFLQKWPGTGKIVWVGSHVNSGASLVAQMVKNPPAMEGTQVHSSGQEDPLEKRMATHSSILPWCIPWTKEPDGLQFMGLQRVKHNWLTNTHTR